MIAIGYDVIRTQAPVGNGKLSKDALYEKASRYLKRTLEEQSGFNGILEFARFYEEMDRWKEGAVIDDKELSYLMDGLFKKISSESEDATSFGALAFEGGKLSIVEKGAMSECK